MKAGVLEWDAGTWANARVQLEKNLVEPTKEDANGKSVSGQVYGAVAVGRYVTFCSFDGLTGRTVLLMDEIAMPLHILSDCSSVHGLLQHFKSITSEIFKQFLLCMCSAVPHLFAKHLTFLDLILTSRFAFSSYF